MALGLGLFFWIALLFSPLAMVQPVAADDADNVGTVIGIVSQLSLSPSPGGCSTDITLTASSTGSGNHLLLCRCDAKGQG
jgi:hypothetical protein